MTEIELQILKNQVVLMQSLTALAYVIQRPSVKHPQMLEDMTRHAIDGTIDLIKESTR